MSSNLLQQQLQQQQPQQQPQEQIKQNIQKHYDSKSTETLKDRWQSKIIELRKFNNQTKKYLISTYTRPNDRVLDLGSGSGGDMGKYYSVGVKTLHGVDISYDSIQKCTRRAPEYLPSMETRFIIGDYTQFPMAPGFYNPSDNKSNPYESGLASDSITTPEMKSTAIFSANFTSESYDIVYCMFAIHYAFETQQQANNFFKNVAHYLKPGGTFICTLLNGDMLQTQFKSEIKNSICSILPRGQDKIYFELDDRVALEEPIIKQDHLIFTAASHGLAFCGKESFDEIYHRLKNRYKNNPKLFKLYYNSNPSKDEWDVIKLYSSFIFCKK